jgi:hypothetical protein
LHLGLQETIMPKRYNTLGTSVPIAGAEFIGPYAGYGGNYSTSNNTTDNTYSYYLNGDTQDTDVPHFTTGDTNKGTGNFVSFHITVYVNGANAGVWYNMNNSGGIDQGNINFNNMPQSRRAQVIAQLPILGAMATQFWNTLNT